MLEGCALNLKLLTLAVLMSVLTASGFAVAEPLKVYILAGQSNMVGMASAKTLDHIKMTPGSALTYADIFDENGDPVVLDEVYIYSTATSNGEAEHGKLGPEWGARGRGERIGPEYGFGVYMHKALNEPILIIKPAWGGKSLHFDFRPPRAGQWTPPAGHPDLAESEPPTPLPIPDSLDVEVGYVPDDDILPRYTTGRVGKFLGLVKMRGVAVDKVHGVYPIYIASGPRATLAGEPFKKGDLLIGVDGEGLREDAIQHWREVFYAAKDDDMLINVTRWRDGKIETFDFDISQILPEGRAGIAKYKKEQADRRAAQKKNKGHYYREMMRHVKTVLADIKKVYPDYDEQAGYALAGFVWFQGWNDMIDGGVYPNANKPGGYEQYSWLLKQFMRDVRRDLDAPELPFVIGVMGVGGVIENPIGASQHHFRRAMAAPADDPEFKDTVKAVYTENYWDEKLAKLAARSRKVENYKAVLSQRDGLEGDELNDAYAAYRSLYFTPEQEAYLKAGKSNQEFHYLGSGKFMVGAGRGFAEAMLDLQRAHQASDPKEQQRSGE